MASTAKGQKTVKKGEQQKSAQNQTSVTKKVEKQQPDPIPEPFTDVHPAQWNNMFGSLFGVSEASAETRIQLTENWHRIIRCWYPDLHQKVYSAPPIHFKQVSYKPKPEKPIIQDEPYLRFGMRLYVPTQYSTTKDDEAQQRVLWTFSAFCRQKSGTAFILSNMEFQNYLNKSYVPYPGSGTLPKANTFLQNEEGEIDVLIIDKKFGVFVLEVKAQGDPPGHRNVSREQQLTELCDKFMKIGKQMKKELEVVNKLIADLNTKKDIKVKGGFVFANIQRDVFEEALDTFHFPCQELQQALGITDKQLIINSTFCAEELPERYTSGERVMDEEIFQRIDKIWSGLEDVYGKSTPMDDDLYEKIVARLCGPLTTVKIYTEKTCPRVKLEVITKTEEIKKKKKHKQEPKIKMVPEEAVQMAGAARIMARRFSELVLLEDQIEVLQRNEEFVHLEGPPGTGKTLVLLLRILTWLDDGHIVWLLSLSPPSRSVTHVLMEQVKKMIAQYHDEDKAKELKGRLRLFMLIRHESTLDREYYKRRLLKFRLRAKTTVRNYAGYPRPPTQPPVAAPHDRKVCLVVDECGMAGKGLHAFFSQVSKLQKAGEFRNQEFSKGLSVWSASLERVGRPCYVTSPGNTDKDKFGVLWNLKLPIRCPPTVQRALMLVQPSLDQKNVCCFQKENMLPHPMCSQYQSVADGLPVYLIAHGSHKNSDKDIWYCKECGDDLGNYLQNTLRIGQEQCDCKHKEINFDSDPSHPAVCADCGKVEKGRFPLCDRPLKYNDVMIVATQNAFQFSVPIGGFAHALAKRKLKVSVNTTREEGDAPIPPDDVILIADLTSIHGLERAIIIIVPEVNPPRALPSEYSGMIFNPVESDLPQQMQEQIAAGQAADKLDLILDADGNRLDDDDEPEDLMDQQIVEPDTTLPEAAETPNDVSGTDQRTGADLLDEDVEMRDVEADKTKDPHPVHETEMQDSNTQIEEGGPKEPGIPVEQKDPCTFADCHSEEQISAGLASLSPQSRRDVFYIGSRAVCQLIMIHRAKDPRKAEPMQAE